MFHFSPLPLCMLLDVLALLSRLTFPLLNASRVSFHWLLFCTAFMRSTFLILAPAFIVVVCYRFDEGNPGGVVDKM